MVMCGQQDGGVAVQESEERVCSRRPGVRHTRVPVLERGTTDCWILLITGSPVRPLLSARGCRTFPWKSCAASRIDSLQKEERNARTPNVRTDESG